MNETRRKEQLLQNELALLKKFVPVLDELDLLHDRSQYHALKGLLLFSSSFAIEIHEDPVVLSLRIEEQLRMMQDMICTSLEGLELYQKIQQARAGEVDDARTKGYIYGSEVGFKLGADDLRDQLIPLLDACKVAEAYELIYGRRP